MHKSGKIHEQDLYNILLMILSKTLPWFPIWSMDLAAPNGRTNDSTRMSHFSTYQPKFSVLWLWL